MVPLKLVDRQTDKKGSTTFR